MAVERLVVSPSGDRSAAAPDVDSLAVVPLLDVTAAGAAWPARDVMDGLREPVGGRTGVLR
jgi:hypothetical protein